MPVSSSYPHGAYATDQGVAVTNFNSDVGGYALIRGSAVAGTADLPTTAAPLQSFMLRNNTSEPANIIVDEVRVGDTWKDVTSAVTVPVPEPTAFGILVFGATVAIRRRK